MRKNDGVIYLDYAATTPVAPEVARIMCASFENLWANGSSDHVLGKAVRQNLQGHVENIAHFFDVHPDEIILTSGATVAINLAVKGVMKAQKKKHLITTTVEHKATLQTVQALVKEGYKATFIAPDQQGQITAEMIEAAITEETALITLLWVNNETGEVYDIPAISAAARRRKVLLHVDATQAVPHFKVDITIADLVSLTAHKLYGPKGIGLLYKRAFPKIPLASVIDGARASVGQHLGTLPNHQIIGFSQALSLLEQYDQVAANTNIDRCYALQERLAPLGVERNAGEIERVPSIINIYMPHVYAETLMEALPRLCLAKGSACSSEETLPSHVLTELGYTKKRAHQSIRISLGRYLEENEFNEALDLLYGMIEVLQNIAHGKKGTWKLPMFDDTAQSYLVTLVEAQDFEITDKLTLKDELLTVTMMINQEKGIIRHVSAAVEGSAFMIWVLQNLVQNLRGVNIATLSKFKITEKYLQKPIPLQAFRLLIQIEALIQQLAGSA